MSRMGLSYQRSATLAGLATAALFAVPSHAVVLIDTDFTAADGYNDGSILFQSPNGGGNGIWLGQSPSSGMVPNVDSVAGTVSTLGGPGSGGGGNFRRNTWSLGAVGGTLGGDGSNELNQAGFNEGDKIKIGIDYQFTLGPTTANTTFFQVGVKDCFVACSFEASPFAGLELGYSGFEDGLLRIFTDIGRVVSTPTDAAFALQIDMASVGIDNGFSGPEPVDLVSDNLSFVYEAELTDASTDTWTATEVTVTNLDTATVIGQASIDAADSLESFVWNTTSMDNPFTEANEAGVARGDGSDMFLGLQWLSQGSADDAGVTSRLSFEYLPNLPPVEGDYNGDGLVDAADYTVWRDSNGTVGAGLPADGTGDDLLGVPDGDVDSFDRDYWAANYGGPAAAAAAVPEPASLLTIVTGLVIPFARRR